MQPPLIYVGVQRPCLLFLLLSHEPDQPFRFGTVAFDYRQSKDLLIHANMPKIFADVVQVSHHTFATYPILARIDDRQHYIHLSEFAALQSPFCALCYLHTLGAPQRLMHNASPASTVIHLLGGLDGTGGSSIIGVLAQDGVVPSHNGSPYMWLTITKFELLQTLSPLLRTKFPPLSYGHQCGIRSHRPCDECPGNLGLDSYNPIRWTHQENILSLQVRRSGAGCFSHLEKPQRREQIELFHTK